jgi:LPS-assembly protein
VLALSRIALAEDEPCPSSSTAPKTAAPASTQPDPPQSNDIQVESDDATLGINGDANLKGNVRVKQGEREIRANDVEYNAADTSMKVNGEVEYLDSLVHATGNGGTYSATEGANFNAAEFELRERSARGAAGAMRLTPDGVIRLDDVKFTTCPRTDEAWQLHAKSITLNTRERLGTGRGASVNFKGVPLIYLPVLSFPLGNERKSGFLFPSAGFSSRSGVQFAVPYYWNIAPQADLTFEPVLYGRRGIDAAGEVRYLTPRQTGSLAVNYLPNDSVADESRYRFKLDHVAELPYDFRFNIDAETVSDNQYFEDFGQGPEGTSTSFVERFARLSYRDEHWLLAGEFQHFQTIDRELADVDRPYARLPRLIANADYGWGASERLRYGLESELVNFDRSIGVTGWRLDAMPTTSLDLGGAGFFVRPGVAWRYTQYELSDTTPGESTSPSRSLPIASLDAGMIFEKPTGSHGQRRLTLEPRMLYLNIPFRQQEELPLFDTALPDLNLVQLFRTNRYVGADRVSDANQVAVGVTSRLYDSGSGAQYLSATLGQIHYFESPRVLLPGETRRGGESSDLVAQLSLTAYKNWNADLGLQWNPDDSRTERSQISIQYKPGPERVINAGYRFQRERLDQAEVSAAWPIAQRWNAYARYVHSFRDETALERFAGFEYRSCCWKLRILGRRFVSSRTGEQDTGVYLQLELTGLASVGSAADAFLTTAIRGYTRPETTP